MWRLVLILIVLTFGVMTWLGVELELFPTSKAAIAAEQKTTATEDLKKGLAKKSREVQQRESELSHREQALLEKEKVLAEQMGRYEKVISELRAKVTELENMKDARMDSFRQVYEKMEAKKASKILDSMDIALASQILGGMKGERAAEILGNMSSERARIITEKYLNHRNLASSKVNEVPQNKEMKGGEQ